MKMEKLKVLIRAEQLSNDIWPVVHQWGAFARDTVGKQMVRAADSIGANIAESFGQFHFGEKIKSARNSGQVLKETQELYQTKNNSHLPISLDKLAWLDTQITKYQIPITPQREARWKI